MSGSIARSVQKIKTDIPSIVTPELITRLCVGAKHEWRERTLGPVQTIYLFMAQILHGNTSCTHVRQFGGFTFASSAYCRARKRLPVSIFRALLREIGQRVTEEAEADMTYTESGWLTSYEWTVNELTDRDDPYAGIATTPRPTWPTCAGQDWLRQVRERAARS